MTNKKVVKVVLLNINDNDFHKWQNSLLLLIYINCHITNDFIGAPLFSMNIFLYEVEKSCHIVKELSSGNSNQQFRTPT